VGFKVPLRKRSKKIISSFLKGETFILKREPNFLKKTKREKGLSTQKKKVMDVWQLKDSSPK